MKLPDLCFIAATLAVCACNHKDLCYDHIDHAPTCDTAIRATYNCQWEIAYDNMTDWENRWEERFGMTYEFLKPGVPEGLRAVVYDADSRYNESNHHYSGGTVRMSPGNHQILLYNNDTEFIRIDNLKSFADAMATTRARSRASYRGNPYYALTATRAEVTVAPPDMLYGHWAESYEAVKSMTAASMDVEMSPLTFTYLIRYEFEHGAGYVGIARGALAGMAAGVYLHDGHTSQDAVTILYDCYTTDWGVEAKVMSFGVPGFPNPDYSRTDRTYGLNLEIKLKNGKTFSYDFDITEQMRRQPHGGVITVSGISISDETGNQGGSGFDITVDDWGEEKDVDLIL